MVAEEGTYQRAIRSSRMSTSQSQPKQAKVSAPKSRVLKEKKARFYIIRRCVFMLLCWRKDGD
ncbi:hypothetical protein WN943_012979 [Citrus x changshan-huyou]